MFKGKKENYPFSVCRPFEDTRIGKKKHFFFLLCATEIYINTHCDFLHLWRSGRHKHQSATDDPARAHKGKLNLSFSLNAFRHLHTVSQSQYSVPVVKYDRNGFRPRLRQLIFTQEAAYLVGENKIKQRISYSSLKGQQRENPSGTASWHWEW